MRLKIIKTKNNKKS